MIVKKPTDIEYLVQKILNPYIKTYCRPLPKAYELPNILVTRVGGTELTDWSGRGHLDNFTVELYCRAKDEGTAQDTLSTAVAILKDSDELRNVVNNTDLGRWGADPVRPDLAMFSVSLIISVSLEELIIPDKQLLSDGLRAVQDGHERLLMAN